MRRIVLTFGLIAGAILSAMMLLTLPFHDRIGFDRALVVGYTTMVLAFLMVFFGVKSYRDNVADGSVTFGRAFKVGLLITAIGTVCWMAGAPGGGWPGGCAESGPWDERTSGCAACDLLILGKCA
jgi:hypothetical protein